jgi:hypothetical protein
MGVASRRVLLGILVGTMVSGAAQAKRAAPQDVAPVVARGIRYEVPHFGALHGEAQNGGYVRAWDVKSKKMLWDRAVYSVRYDPQREKDVQDVFITEIRVRGGRLLVKNERSEEFEMDLASGRVRALTPLGPNTVVPAEGEQ